jgi:hypothetical protein
MCHTLHHDEQTQTRSKTQDADGTSLRAPGHENLTHLPKTSWSAKGQTRFCVEKIKMIEFQPRLLPAALTTY